MTDRPSHVRWMILGVTTLCSLLLYLDRICVAFAAESIRVEFSATPEQMGWFISAFFWSYALAQVPSGWLSDRLGIRSTLTAYILLWSLFTGLMGVATGIIAIIGFRLGCGLAQAGAYPSAARAVRDWMPVTQRGTASSVVALGGRIGGVLAPILTGVVMLMFATADGSSNIQTVELRDGALLAKALIPTTEPSWRTVSWTAMSESDQATVRAAASAGDSGSPAALLDVVNRLNLVETLGQFSRDDAAHGLPPEIARRFLGQASQNPDLTRRKFLDAVAPTAIRKLEARGWRRTMIVYGVAGILVAAAFWWLFRETPAVHPWCNRAERELIGNVAVVGSRSALEPLPLAAMVGNLSLWGNCVSQFATNVGWVFLVTWLPRYLEDVHRVPVLERGVLSSIPIAAGMIGMLLGGPWTDVMSRRFGLKAGRRWPVMISRLLAGCGYGGCLLSAAGVAGPLGSWPPAILAVAGLGLVAIGTDLGVAATWAFAQDVGGQHTASVLGWGNMWGNLGAAVAPFAMAKFLGENPTLGDWNLVFAFCAGAFVVAACGASLMDASRPLVAPDEAQG
ncbi:MAG TPA: MFS transporter [Planctomycetaceae bacterium]|nr:MFS transporter [Planctomycetaceae bacterium]